MNDEFVCKSEVEVDPRLAIGAMKLDVVELYRVASDNKKRLWATASNVTAGAQPCRDGGVWQLE